MDLIDPVLVRVTRQSLLLLFWFSSKGVLK